MLNKQSMDISFAKGLDLKSDPKRVVAGNFVKLENTVFVKAGLLEKRNGYAELKSLPTTDYSYVTTFNNDLTAIGSTDVASLSAPTATWVSKGKTAPLSLETIPLVNNSKIQKYHDSAVSPNGLVCTVFYNLVLHSSGVYIGNTRYSILDSNTGQVIVDNASVSNVSGAFSSPKVFYMTNKFVIIFVETISTVVHLRYITVSTSDTSIVSAAADVASLFVPNNVSIAYDGLVVNDLLYVCYNTTTGGQSVKLTIISPNNTVTSPITFAAAICTQASIAADMSIPNNPIIYVNWWDDAGNKGYTAVVDKNMSVITAPVEHVNTIQVANMASIAYAGTCRIFYEISQNYGCIGGVASNYVMSIDVTQAGAVSAAVVRCRSVGLASKPFIIGVRAYILCLYFSTYQSTYFLIDALSSVQEAPIIIAKLAASNAADEYIGSLNGSSFKAGITSVTVINDKCYFSYLYKNLIQSVSKATAPIAGTPVTGVYTQTGIRLAKISFGTTSYDTAEIGNMLHLSGGFLSSYDGQLLTENNFFIYPDVITTTMPVYATTGGFMAAKPDGSTTTNAYWYKYVYEWRDNQGNTHRSAPSIAMPVTTSGTASTGTVTLYIPTLRLTMKVQSNNNPVRLVVYRWSVGQQMYYQVTNSSVLGTVNDLTVDYITFVDTLSDASILGNTLLYTTGNVVENTNAPATSAMTLFDSRLWMIMAEDNNLLWYSKQVIENTPVEMSDLLTMYIPPTTGAQGSTGAMTSLNVMDDKLIIFKNNAIYYINGSGPDNTGYNSQYNPPTFISSTVGCINQKSICFCPQGLIFQSNKGIWLLGRDMSTTYIGSRVENYNNSLVISCDNIPATNQVRICLNTGETLVYDYFFDQWSTFKGVPGVSSCIFQDLHTIIDSYGRVFQESVGTYLDGTTPVLMAFKTGPLRVGELQNYQRAYACYLLGEFLSPHKLVMSLCYDYNTTPTQQTVLTPLNSVTLYGGSSPYGQSGVFGGTPSLEQYRLFFTQQRCQAVSIEFQEVIDPAYVNQAGAGLTISGINVLLGFKGKAPTMPSNQSFG